MVFFEPLIKQLSKKHDFLCTSRDYSEAKNLATIRKFNVKVVGKFGGADKAGKLFANIDRMNQLYKIITKFNPNLTISFCSPDASRISFGLGIKHIAYCDSPHAEAVMRLTLPLIQKLLVPWIIPKKESKQNLKLKKPHKKIILIRMEEAQSAYSSKSKKIIPIIKKIIDKFSEENIIILTRYSEQKKELSKLFGTKTQILDMVFDGKLLLENADVFIGSGGTMTAESALFGVPTISYGASPNLVESYLIKKSLIKREKNPDKITKIIKKSFASNNQTRKKAKKLLRSMENPHLKLIKIERL
jgi:predicted glycosyltransferase